MTKQTMVSTSINNDPKVKKNACKKHEVQVYLINTNNNNNLRPLEWWQVNGGNIVMWIDFRKSGWQFRKLPLQTSACSQYLGYWIMPNVQISSEYQSKSKYSATKILTNFIEFKNIVFVFTIIYKRLTDRWQWVTNPTMVHGKRGVNIQTADTSNHNPNHRSYRLNLQYCLYSTLLQPQLMGHTAMEIS